MSIAVTFKDDTTNSVSFGPEEMPVKLSQKDSFGVDIQESTTGNISADTAVKRLSASFGEITRITSSDIPVYTGAYTITPSAESVVLQTSGKYASANIVINPIPSNYGRISYDGYALTIT